MTPKIENISHLKENNFKYTKKVELKVAKSLYITESTESYSSWKSSRKYNNMSVHLKEHESHLSDVFYVFTIGCKTQEKNYISQNSSKFLSENDPDLLIQEYFIARPDDRAALRGFTAKHINSVNAVLEVLNWSRKKGIREAYDSAIALLAERGEILLKVVDNDTISASDTQDDIYAFEEKWEVLIKSIACACHLTTEQKLNTIRKLIPNQTRRLVKTAIIDALLIMQDEIGGDVIRRELEEYFLSSGELDEYIREYARDAIEEV